MTAEMFAQMRNLLAGFGKKAFFHLQPLKSIDFQ